MRTGRTTWLCLLGACLFAPVSRTLADANPNQYDVIADRNVFKLRPLPPPPDLTATPPTPPSNVTLTGITDILGDKMALMEAQPQGKPKIYLMLSEGQRDGDVTVVAINQKSSTVTIKNGDQTQTLDLNAAAKRAASASAVAGVNPGGSAIPAPSGVNSIRDARARGIEARRELRTVSSGDVPNLPSSGGNDTGSSVGSSVGVNPRATASSEPKTMSIEEQVVAVELNRAATQPQVDAGQMPPLPTPPRSVQNILNQPSR